jgi:NADH-quinone oxidoreductase subunit J
MVLFLFVIMLMNLNAEAEPVKNVYMKMAGVISGMSLLIVLVAALSHSDIQNTVIRPGTSVGLIKNLGKALFTQYVVPFELASVLFLSAMVGAIVLGKKDVVKKTVI